MDRFGRQDRNPAVCRAFIYYMNFIYIDSPVKHVILNVLTISILASVEICFLATQNWVRKDFSSRKRKLM